MGKADKAGGADNMGKVDKNIVRNKLDSLARCLLHIEEDRPATVEDLMEDFRLQNSIVLELQRAVQICVDVGMHLVSAAALPAPGTMGETFAALHRMGVIDEDTAERLRKAVGFRNIAVHAYEEIDYAVVFSIVTRHLGDFRKFAGQIATATGLAAA